MDPEIHPTVTAYIVDDEGHAISLLENILRKTEGINVLGHAMDVVTALAGIIRLKPDIVFLDIEMPGKTGFDLAYELQECGIEPVLVFITAYNEFAIEAIRHAAFDFLLKPVMEEELMITLSRFRKKKSEQNLKKQLDTLMGQMNADRLRFTTRTGFIYLNIKDILYFQANSNYTDVICTDDSIKTISCGLGQLEEVISPAQFMRISRSCIINALYITEINKKQMKCLLNVDGKILSLNVSQSHAKNMM